MAQRKPKKAKALTPRQVGNADQRLIRNLIEPAAMTKGLYAVEAYAVTEGEFPGEAPGNIRVVRNRGGTAVDRWRAAGDIDDRQMAAIQTYVRCHETVFGKARRVTAKYNQEARDTGFGAEEGFNHKVMDAKDMLWNIDYKVFQNVGFDEKKAFKDVVIYNLPCSGAGLIVEGTVSHNARISQVKKGVLLCASLIANIVIDGGKEAETRETIEQLRAKIVLLQEALKINLRAA